MDQPDYDRLLTSGIKNASIMGHDPDWLTSHIVGQNHDPALLAGLLVRALIRLAEPARVGQLDSLADELAEALYDHFDNAGLPYYRELVNQVLMPAIREHAVPEAVDA